MSTAKKALVIVESPSKAKTIGKFLGSNYKVMASVGHIRDLPKSKLGIRIEDNFEPEYISIRGKGDIIKELKKEAKNASKVYLATDPDREGEAISWHIAYLLDIDPETPCRIMFNEITKTAIQNAVKSPRKLDMNLIDAQQGRRVLDRLVGYKISPLLWRKVRPGLSAGRVQSAALKILCDREIQIRDFIPKEYWNIIAMLEHKKIFPAKLAEYKGAKLTVENGAEADKIQAELEGNPYVVKTVEEKERIRKPYPPFTTSSLQQEASNKFNFTTKKTMLIAQQLYEGVDIKGKGTIGLVSYIRTDSVRVSDDAIAGAVAFIEGEYGKQYVGHNVYSNKKKDVQDAHEAIRPSYSDIVPDSVKDSLTKDQYLLYKLIWSRFIASRMTAAVYDGVTAEIENGEYLFKAVGSKLRFDGFLKVYKDDAEDGEKQLPPLEVGQNLPLKELLKEQNFTQPPSRFTEASLVKDLEEKNIGRPSTYAPIVGTLLERKYVTKEKKSLIPTELGFVVTELMETYFKEIVDAGFTAEMEDKLDAVEVENADWKKIIADFYATLKEELEFADSQIEKMPVEEILSDEVCENCGKPMAIKHGRFGEFLACTGYPDCKTTKAILKKIDVSCPACGKEIAMRKSKKGKIFYGCSGYPDCNQVYWYRPVDKKCPTCGAQLVEKKSKGGSYACSNSECTYKE